MIGKYVRVKTLYQFSRDEAELIARATGMKLGEVDASYLSYWVRGVIAAELRMFRELLDEGHLPDEPNDGETGEL